MSKIALVLVGSQLLYSLSDFMGRAYLARHGFKGATFLSLWFLLYQLVRQVAMFGQLYLFAHAPLGKTMAMLAASSIVFSNILGWLLLGEVLSPAAYAGVSLAVVSVLIMALN